MTMQNLREPSQKKTVAKYQQVQQALEMELADGKYPAGHRLPTERELASQFSVSVLTLRQSLSGLEKKGLISRQQGRGTFVESQEKKTGQARQDKPRNSSSPGSIAFVFIDPPKIEASYQQYDSIYYRDLLRMVDKQIAAYQKHLIVTHTSTKDLAAGIYPQVLKAGSVQGIILDGCVNDFHVEALKQFGLPVIVLGNVPLFTEVCNICYNVNHASYLITKALLERDKGPVFLAVEPFRIALTHNQLEGYSEACREFGQHEYVRVFNQEYDYQAMFEEMIEQAGGAFSLFLGHGLAASALLNVYRDRKMTLADYPVVVYGAAPLISEENHRSLNVIDETCPPLYVEVGVELLEGMIKGREGRSVVLEPEIKTWDEKGEFRLDLTWRVPGEEA